MRAAWLTGNVALFQLLAVELLNVLHRLLLTRDPPAVQLQVTAVVQETVRAALEHLQRWRSHQGQQPPRYLLLSLGAALAERKPRSPHGVCD